MFSTKVTSAGMIVRFPPFGELCVGTLARGHRYDCEFSLGCSAADDSRHPLKMSLLLEEDSSHRVEGEISVGLRFNAAEVWLCASGRER
jgi:hypothetical protein